MGLKSQLSEFLLKKADAPHVPALDVGFVPSLPSRILDSDEPHPESTPLPSSPDAEGQTFVICYVNAKEAQSTRRITVHALKRTSEARVLLFARCAETKEIMSFRADRIKYCMDVTGEIYEPPAMFLVEIFGLGPSDAELLAAETAGRGITWPPKDEAYCVLRQQLRNELTLLTAMAESDGLVSLVESEAILAYARRRSDRLGIHLDEARTYKLQGFIRRLRPTEDQINAAIDDISARPAKAQMDMVLACSEVMLADGLAHTEEIELLEKVRADLARG